MRDVGGLKNAVFKYVNDVFWEFYDISSDGSRMASERRLKMAVTRFVTRADVSGVRTPQLMSPPGQISKKGVSSGADLFIRSVFGSITSILKNRISISIFSISCFSLIYFTNIIYQ